MAQGGGKILLAAAGAVILYFVLSRSFFFGSDSNSLSNMASANGNTDLMIIGAGVLGKRVAYSWRARYPKATIVGVTRHEQAPDWMKDIKVEHLVRKDMSDNPNKKFANVIFCIPPQTDYAGEAVFATKQWDDQGQIVFSSSAGVYSENGGGLVTALSPVLDDDRTRAILETEDVFRVAGGTAVRFGGLFTATRGAHHFWAKKIAADPNYVVANGNQLLNMIHYDDAAQVLIAALLRKGREPNLFVACDGHPVTKTEIWQSAVDRHWVDASHGWPAFTPCQGQATCGKEIDCSLLRDSLGWKPEFPPWGQPLHAVRPHGHDATSA